VDKVSPDELEAWLGQAVTKGFFEEIEAMTAEAQAMALGYVAAEEFYKASQVGGYIQALADIRELPKEWAGDDD
tara:strand:- start:7190 stop:7411 length:222 start_codon:yes stop_codon:yes gene_type:complete